ncbi:putative CLAVATA3/ESR (CLE)-related protein 27 [Forsythia ovata]|uniref:CLAVATA3/ESR (CLE)-related protein 27 n=1 Tax=Forsythia ovata TaxID=205694 RepID=A0ABD1W9V4_9LAMI
MYPSQTSGIHLSANSRKSDSGNLLLAKSSACQQTTNIRNHFPPKVSASDKKHYSSTTETYPNSPEKQKGLGFLDLYVGFPAMSFSGGRKTVMVLVIISVLHIWVFNESEVEAIRILQEHAVVEEKPSQTMKSSKTQTENFRRYFNGRVSSQNGTFFDSERRTPNCPDPLHNK